ncbi:MAG: hypothetical protein DWQ07_05885 [Chloroflexi bacterium]|nr:MAG: hypothetical protein DWQ07_05885 [Chloroflexota bacterium]MBL1196699.1 hypothetical protein [Chloroflexota bacterium]NOH13992.1 hypothetical protein [Chloroflexota bacterium]
MTILSMVLILFFGISAFVIALLVVIFWILSQRELGGQSATSMPTSSDHSVSANFFGQRSAGTWQIRGNGQLAVASDGLYFQRALPSRIYFVDYRDIMSVETPSSFLGKTRFVPLLQINFTNDTRQADAMAWQVGDVDGIKGMIENRIATI